MQPIAPQDHLKISNSFKKPVEIRPFTSRPPSLSHSDLRTYIASNLQGVSLFNDVWATNLRCLNMIWMWSDPGAFRWVTCELGNRHSHSGLAHTLSNLQRTFRAWVCLLNQVKGTPRIADVWEVIILQGLSKLGNKIWLSLHSTSFFAIG